MKWIVVLGIVAVGFLGISLLDKQRERDCLADAFQFLQVQPTPSEVTI